MKQPRAYLANSFLSKFKCYSHFDSNIAIAIKFCISHDSYAVMACVKIYCWSDRQQWNYTKAKFPSNLNLGQKSLVKRSTYIYIYIHIRDFHHRDTCNGTNCSIFVCKRHPLIFPKSSAKMTTGIYKLVTAIINTGDNKKNHLTMMWLNIIIIMNVLI